MIVYRTENLLNGKFYYGVHNSRKPRYLGSGTALKRAIKKYGRDNFIRRTIKEFDTAKEAYAFETLMVDDLLINNPMCYNATAGGTGGSAGRVISDETRTKMSIAGKKRVFTQAHRDAMSKTRTGKKQPQSVIDARMLHNKTKVYIKTVNTKTGEEYRSIKDAWRNSNSELSYRGFRAQVNGTTTNKTFYKINKL